MDKSIYHMNQLIGTPFSENDHLIIERVKFDELEICSS